jgi:hypothetical protein
MTEIPKTQEEAAVIIGSKNKPKAPTPVADTAAPQCGGDNAPPPEVGAEIMKAKMAALDDGLDIPEPAAA